METTMQNNIYYVYVYIHPETGDCFYVGKGKKNRDTSHLREVLNNKEPRNKIQKEKFLYLRELINSGKIPLIKRIVENLEEKESLVIESILIDFYGLADNEGQLLNKKSQKLFSKYLSYSISNTLKEFYKKNNSPMKGKKTSDEVRLKQSLSRKRFFDNGGKTWNLGMKMTKELCDINSIAQKKRFKKNRQHNALYWVTPYGVFESRDKAGESCGITAMQIRSRCQMYVDTIPKHKKILLEIKEKYGEDKIGLSWREIGFYTQSSP